MQLKKCFIPLISIAAFISCKKEPVTRVVEFKSTTYQTLANFDSMGKPANLLSPDTVSANLSSFINNMLPAAQNLGQTHPELLTTSAIADIAITKSSDVYITYVSSGTGYTNAFAFYTYPTTQPPASPEDIKNIIYIFPNAGNHTTLKQGDKVKIGKFEAGTSIGFVILQEAWNVASHSLDNKVVHFCSNDVLNPEVDPNLKKHAVLINYPPEHKVLIGFEDIDRTNAICDNDFNDLLFYCTVTN